MRTRNFAALLVSIAVSAGPIAAQRIAGNGAQSAPMTGNMPATQPRSRGWNAPRPVPSGHWNNGPRPQQQNPQGGWHNRPDQQRPSRWGNKIGGHWYAGHSAPGGWKGYRRPTRGWTLPRYWIAPSFYISDYSSYGLSSPPYGYNWTRYYDDAVLLDQRGQVWDSVSGLDWDRYDSNGDDDAYDADGGYGAAQGYDQQQGYGAGYPPPPIVYGQPAEVVQGGGHASGYQQQGGYVSGGYWYPPATTTTVTIASGAAHTVTTTTDYIDEVVYTAPRKVYAKKKLWRPKSKVRQCACACRC